VSDPHTCEEHTCAACNAPDLEAFFKKQREIMERVGWIVHYVLDHEEKAVPFVNAHTHGILEKYGHADLQICLATRLGVPTDVIHQMLHAVVRQIEDGVVFAAGHKSGEVMEGYDVKFVDAEENGRHVLRVLLPDNRGAFPDEPGCTKELATQATFAT